MPHIPLKIKLTRSTSCLAPFTATGEILCPDRIPQGQRSFMMVLIDWDEKAGEVEIFFNKPTSGGGDIRFDGPDGPTKKVIDEDTRKVFVIYGQAPTAGSAPDVELVVRDKKTEYSRVPMSVGPTATNVQIKAENGTDTAQLFMVPETTARFKAVVTPAASGTFRWASVPSSAVEIKGDRDKELVEVAAHAPSGFRPKGFDNAPALCVLFTPAGGQAIMAVHRIWPLAAPDEPGPFPVGRATYTAADYPIDPANPPVPGDPAELKEGLSSTITVTVEGLVRYPAESEGENKPFSTYRTKYPLVILAHGRHRPFEFERDSDGDYILDGAGKKKVILASGGTKVAEFKNHEGLEYLASHLASYGFIAASINLNGKYLSTNKTTAGAQLYQPQGKMLTCRPLKLNEVAIAHRGLVILRHIKVMGDKNLAVGDRFKDRVDLDAIALIGHSRGGEAVVSAYELRSRLPGNKIKGVLSIAPTDFRNINVDTPYCVIAGSEDGDVIEGGGLRLYDRAQPPKQMIWVHGAIHNYFSSNWHWQDEVSAEPPVSREQHQDIARGYANVFLQRYLNGFEAADLYFTAERAIGSLSGVEMHHAYQTIGGKLVDDFENVPADKTKNSLNGGVTVSGLGSFDESSLRYFATGPPKTLVPGDKPDILAGKRDRITGCAVGQRNWFHDTNGLLIKWTSLAGTYTTALSGLKAGQFKVLSFRVAQDTTVNAKGATQNFKVKLTDTNTQQAVHKVGDFARIPFPRKKEQTYDVGKLDYTKSVLKTVRIPLQRFKDVNPKLDLDSLASLSFEFSEKAPGMLGFDDVEFSQ